MKKVEKTVKYMIKVKSGHPQKRYQIQDHAIFQNYQEYELNEKAEKELTTNPGCNRWCDYYKVKEQPAEEVKKEEVEKEASIQMKDVKEVEEVKQEVKQEVKKESKKRKKK